MGPVIKRFDVYLVALDPTIGHEIQKTRPCQPSPFNLPHSLMGQAWYGGPLFVRQ